ncbi:hypothetical protein QR685DRAFT_510269 [Neurospora intermedia]|uniref:Uncharacterized protein n=1 Tax=Neurospora intermedia TaxID=5142 RepID=A0ABR3DPJ2_NEUIN
MITETLRSLIERNLLHTKETEITTYAPGLFVGLNLFGVICAYVEIQLDELYSGVALHWRTSNGALYTLRLLAFLCILVSPMNDA